MSRTTSRSSSSSTDDSDHESAGGQYYSQAHGGGDTASRNSTSVMSPETRASRPLDVSNILNPTPRTAEGSRRKSAAHFESPRSTSMANLQNTARSLPPSPIESSDPTDASKFRNSALSRQLAQTGARSSRPSSLGNVTTQQHPYYPSRRFSTYSSENTPAISHTQPPPPPPPPPPLPPQSAAQSSYAFPPGQVSHQQYQQQAQQQQQQQSQQPYQPQQSVSSSASPTTPYSSYTPGQTVSGAQTGIYSQQYGSNQQSLGSPYSMASHSQHGHFPMMALATAHGSIPVSVDTTAASKSADEKRKRNAGASARFRQRRKEREREMTQRITDLEQRLKKAEDERDYYRDMCMRMQQPGRSQQGPPPPPQSQAQPQHPSTHSHQYSHHSRMGGPPPPQAMTLDPPAYGHHGSHPPPPPTPAFPRIGSDVGAGYREGTSGSSYQAPGYQPHQQQQQSGAPLRGDTMTPNTQRRDADRYEQEHGRHH